MELPSFCLFMTATLSIHPDRVQFFRYETVTLNCATPKNFSGWTHKRNISDGSVVLSDCTWGRQKDASCYIRGVYTVDSGQYWCESNQQECSNVLNITVTSGPVILESPAHPVMEGDNVTLRCSTKGRYEHKSRSNFNAMFYKDGVFVGSRPTGEMTFPAVTKSNEGFYKCEHPIEGESGQSFLAVRVRVKPAQDPTSPPIFTLPKLVLTILLFIFYTIIAIICVHMYRKWARGRHDS